MALRLPYCSKFLPCDVFLIGGAVVPSRQCRPYTTAARCRGILLDWSKTKSAGPLPQPSLVWAPRLTSHTAPPSAASKGWVGGAVYNDKGLSKCELLQLAKPAKLSSILVRVAYMPGLESSMVCCIGSPFPDSSLPQNAAFLHTIAGMAPALAMLEELRWDMICSWDCQVV
jgi:hypothetical protein